MKSPPDRSPGNQARLTEVPDARIGVEINEAFTAITLACLRELGFAEDAVNVEGAAPSRTVTPSSAHAEEEGLHEVASVLLKAEQDENHSFYRTVRHAG